MLPSQVSAPEPLYVVEQPQMVTTQIPRPMSTVSSSHYGTPRESPEMLRYQPTAAGSRKRSHQSDFSYDYQGLQQLQAHAGSSAQLPVELTPHGHHAQLQAGASSFYLPSQAGSPPDSYQQQSFQSMTPATHHHHRLPNQPPPAKSARLGDSSPVADDMGPPSMVGQPGMPTPAPKPKGPKLKFTAEDDALLVDLKETKNLTWKQIADFFPGRSSGTLQVRYCTKLKAKQTVWTDDMVDKLHLAMQEYEEDRWRIISSKIGNGFSAAACRDKAAEVDPAEASRQATDVVGEGDEEAITLAHGPEKDDVVQVEAQQATSSSSRKGQAADTKDIYRKLRDTRDS
ncbi:hypothetical protein LTR78_003377 [Recurvomyces mirabilis]|uniref:Myb-like domain-containing protein n=1 Tax=Recurvomyces mirabilis TaxID=574656 RepID=A0AAE0WRQ3_9PEZI|nr:hypothetical protein LTR78_003377 [Recurvomyces mirabilis]KAK5154587.1 hypothetical protein LTS14_006725 [Recurvomyces mirabilis]